LTSTASLIVDFGINLSYASKTLSNSLPLTVTNF